MDSRPYEHCRLSDQPFQRPFHEVGFDGDAVIELAHEKDFQRTRPLRETWQLSRSFVKRVIGY